MKNLIRPAKVQRFDKVYADGLSRLNKDGHECRICLYTKKGYWTGFSFVNNFKDEKCKFYKTDIGARRAAKWLTKHYGLEFIVTCL